MKTTAICILNALNMSLDLIFLKPHPTDSCYASDDPFMCEVYSDIPNTILKNALTPKYNKGCADIFAVVCHVCHNRACSSN